MSTDVSPPRDLMRSLVRKWLKLGIADKARLMADNQKVLDASNDRLRRDQEYEQKVSEAIAVERLGIEWPKGQSRQAGGSGEEMQINIDSPTTITHRYPEAKPQKKSVLASALVKAAVTAALLGSGAGAGVAVPWALGMFALQPPAVEAPVDTTTQIEIE